MSAVNDDIGKYLETTEGIIRRLPADGIARVVEALWQAYEKGRMIFAFGNGGSSACASHFIEDLAKGVAPPAGRPRYRALALTDSVPLITAYANDMSYADVFAEQLRNFVRPGDAVLGISASGNSANVLKGLALANSAGAVTVAFGGMDGGKMNALVREVVIVPSTDMQQIEDAHLVLAHVVYRALKARAEALDPVSP